MSKVILFHGTTKAALSEIRRSGVLEGPVFLTPRKEVAEDYAGDDGVVLEVEVEKELLLLDFDFAGAQLISLEDANVYTESEGDKSIDEWLEEGQSVGIDRNIAPIWDNP
jgi:hypothetical protein